MSDLSHSYTFYQTFSARPGALCCAQVTGYMYKQMLYDTDLNVFSTSTEIVSQIRFEGSG